MKKILLGILLALLLITSVNAQASWMDLADRVEQKNFCTSLSEVGIQTQYVQCLFTKSIQQKCSMESSFICYNFMIFKRFAAYE